MVKEMTDDELRALLAAATPGPWHADTTDPTDVVVWSDEGNLVGNMGHRVQPLTLIFDTDEHNARAISTWPDLAAEVIRLRAKEAAAEKLAEAVRKECRTFNGVSPDLARALAAWEAAK